MIENRRHTRQLQQKKLQRSGGVSWEKELEPECEIDSLGFSQTVKSLISTSFQDLHLFLSLQTSAHSFPGHLSACCIALQVVDLLQFSWRAQTELESLSSNFNLSEERSWLMKCRSEIHFIQAIVVKGREPRSTDMVFLAPV